MCVELFDSNFKSLKKVERKINIYWPGQNVLTQFCNFAAVFEVRDKINVPLLCADKSIIDDQVTILPSVLEKYSGEPLTEKYAGYNDPIFYIYTSGTTGRITFL